MNKYNYFLKSIVAAVLFWLLDSSIHHLFFGEPEFEFVPTEPNELWMRLVIVGLLILFGLYTDKHTARLIKKEKEKRVIFNATISSTQHILNNMLNQTQYLKMLAEESNAFDKESVALFDKVMQEGSELVQSLSNVEELTVENIKEAVEPQP